MIGNINKVAEANDYNEQVIDADALNRFEEFKKHLAESPKDEQIRIAQQFDKGVNKYMDPELKAQISGNIVETQDDSVEVKNSDWDNINKVKELHAAVDAYPNISEAQKKALHDIIYNPINAAENQVADAIQKDKSDKNIEA